MKSKSNYGTIKLVLFVLTMAGSLQATTAAFNWEDQPLVASTTSITDTQGGITVTVTRQNNSPFAVSDIFSSLGPSAPSWLHRTLDPFQAINSNAWIFSFSTAVDTFTTELGDFAGDSDTWTLTAFSGVNGTGTNLGSASGTWGSGSLAVSLAQQASIAAVGIRSVVATGGSTDFPMTLYWDNATASTTTPEPATFTLIGSLFGLCALRLKGRRN